MIPFWSILNPIKIKSEVSLSFRIQYPLTHYLSNRQQANTWRAFVGGFRYTPLADIPYLANYINGLINIFIYRHTTHTLILLRDEPGRNVLKILEGVYDFYTEISPIKMKKSRFGRAKHKSRCIIAQSCVIFTTFCRVFDGIFTRKSQCFGFVMACLRSYDDAVFKSERENEWWMNGVRSFSVHTHVW